jgi:hypothetical protein
VLDLKKEEAREACLALAKKADVLVYNIRPQAMARLKLGYEDVKKINPKIIYVGCFGFSQRGPYAAKAAYDDMIQGAAGIPYLLKKQGAAEPRYAPMIVADRSVGQRVASAVSAALLPRRPARPARRRADVRAPADDPRRPSGRLPSSRRTLAPYRILSPDRRPYKPRTATSARSSTTTSSGAFFTPSATRDFRPSFLEPQ